MQPLSVDSILDLIGQTPLLHLQSLGETGHGSIFAKLEFLNPGGSVKDRPALRMVLDAEGSGDLLPGGTIIEPTAGNTGIGLAMVGIRRGYRVILVVPEGFSHEKTMLMEALGAEVVFTPEEERMPGAISRARDMAARIPGAFVPQQFGNQSNVLSHYETTAVEIWSQMEGRVDAVVIGAGTGGTFTGVARYVKEHNPAALGILVEPEGSIFGGGEVGSHRVEGIGNSFWPDVLDRGLVDEVITVPDADAYTMVRFLARHEGLLLGGSGGANSVAARLVAARLPAGARVATILPDGMERYLSRGPCGDAQATASGMDRVEPLMTPMERVD